MLDIGGQVAYQIEKKKKKKGKHPAAYAAYWINVLSRTVCVIASETEKIETQL